MSWVSGVAIYFVLWWVVLFAVLPWGVRPPEEREPGMASGAPARPRIALKFLVTTLVSAVIFGGFYAAGHWGLIDFRALVRS